MRIFCCALLAMAVLAAPAARADTFELTADASVATLLVSRDSRGGLVLPLGVGALMRLSPTLRAGVTGEMSLTGFSAGARVEHAFNGFAASGALVRFGLGYAAMAIPCDVRCDSLGVDEITFGMGPVAQAGVGWRWSRANDEGGFSVGLSVAAARLQSRRSGASRFLIGGSGPWLSLDW